jgi:hypothetical protein
MINIVLTKFSKQEKVHYSIMNYVYPPEISKPLHDYIVSGDLWIETIKAKGPNHEFLNQTLTKIELTIKNFPDWDVVQSNLKDHISSYDRLFLEWKLNATQRALFNASILKEVLLSEG